MLYLQRATILALVTISIVVALDISSNINHVVNAKTNASLPGDFIQIVYYSLLRASFVAPPILLFAGVWGIVWAEYSLATSRERIMLLNCGKSYIPSLVPAVLLGSVIGLLFFAISGFVKPMTIELESNTTHRSYGLKFDRPAQSEATWIALKNRIIRARVEISDDVRLNEVTVFVLGNDHQLLRIIRAKQAYAAQKANLWTFSDATITSFEQNDAENGRLSKVEEQRFDTLEMDFPISRIWLENLKILPTLLPQPLLHEVISHGETVPESYRYEMAAYERYASILYCIAMALFTAHLAMARFTTDMMPYGALSVAAVGFAAYFFFSLTLMLGHNDYMPVLVAAWSIPILITAISIWSVWSYVYKPAPASNVPRFTPQDDKHM